MPAPEPRASDAAARDLALAAAHARATRNALQREKDAADKPHPACVYAARDARHEARAERRKAAFYFASAAHSHERAGAMADANIARACANALQALPYPEPARVARRDFERTGALLATLTNALDVVASRDPEAVEAPTRAAAAAYVAMCAAEVQDTARRLFAFTAPGIFTADALATASAALSTVAAAYFAAARLMEHAHEDAFGPSMAKTWEDAARRAADRGAVLAAAMRAADADAP